MSASRTANQALKELRRVARAWPRRSSRAPEAAPILARVLAGCRTVAIEKRADGIAIRLQAADDPADRFVLTCVVRDPANAALLTPSERAVADRLCEGRTLAQIATLRGVTVNTIKSQVRQIFRKLDVDTRVALVRRLCP